MALPGLGNMNVMELGKRAYKEFSSDDMSTYAAALSYSVLFALFPFTIFLLTFLGALGLPEFFDWLLEQAQTTLPGEAYSTVEQIVNQVQGKTRSGLLSFGIILALWSASSGVRSLMNALNVAYGVEESRPMWKRYPMSVVYTLGLTIMMIAAAALMLFGPQAMEWVADQAGLGDVVVTLWTWLRLPVAVVLLILIVAMVYYFLPNVDQKFQLITPGAVLAVVVWVAATFVFGIYMSNYANYNATYGSLGGIIMLLFYFFISAATVLLGAEINAIIFNAKTSPQDGDTKSESEPSTGERAAAD